MPAAYAVVPAAVPLAIAPRPDAPRIVPAVERDAYGLPLARASFRVFRILGERNGWAQLETLGEPARAHCADGLETLEPFRLRLFVPVSMLALVTQRETRQEFADGTFIELARGAPLEPLPGVGWFRVHLGGVATTVRLAQADVGTRYLPSAELAPAAAAHALRGDAIGSGAAVLGITGPIESAGGGDVSVYATAMRGAEALVELRPRCGRIVVRAPAHALADHAGEPVVSERETLRADAIVVRAGTTVRWRGGGYAGTVTRDTALDEEVEPSGRLRCFRGSAAGAGIELCFDRRDVVDPRYGAGEALDAPGVREQTGTNNDD